MGRRKPLPFEELDGILLEFVCDNEQSDAGELGQHYRTINEMFRKVYRLGVDAGVEHCIGQLSDRALALSVVSSMGKSRELSHMIDVIGKTWPGREAS